MKKITRTAQSATFSIDLPLMAGQVHVNVNHQISIKFASDCNSGMTLVVTVTPYGTATAESVDAGTFDCYALKGTQKTITLQASVLASATFTIAGRTAGDIDVVYLGYGDVDYGLEV